MRWLGLMCLLLMPVGVRAQATLVADAHVSSVRPDVNAGTLTNLNVGGGYTALVQFDLSMLPAGTTASQVTRAVLVVYCNRADVAGLVAVQPVGAAWGEYSVTYATLPALGSAVQTAQVSGAEAFVSFDVTATVQGWISGSANNGLALTAGSAVLQFDSKENDETGHAPQLQIVLAAGGAGAQGAVGPQGPAGAVGPQGVAGLNGLPGAMGLPGFAGVAGAPGVAGAVGPAGATGPQGLPGNGIPGATGPAGQAGAAGLQGVQGPVGAAGPQGLTGAVGPPGFVNQGGYQSTSNYAVGDVVVFQGSSYSSLVASNHGNTPGLSPAEWGLLTSQGPQGVQGVAGPVGAVGATGVGVAGPAGPPGVQGLVGAVGPVGLPGLVYQGTYASAMNYVLGDVVVFQGASYASLAGSNFGNTPGLSPLFWGLLTAQGPQGVQGFVGATGVAGPQGSPGSVGPPGETGGQGLQGIAGQAGAQGLTGLQGEVGPQGATGAQGVAGPVGMAFRGAYDSTANYALADGVQYGGAGYVSLVAGNHGNTPDQSPLMWSLFATGTPGAAGLAGATGVAGPVGAMGAQGALGVAGPVGAVGPQGPAVVNYLGNYASSSNYGVADAVSYGGSTYVSLLGSNHGNTPDQSPAYWAVLVAQGLQGAVGATGPQGLPGPVGAAGVAGAMGPQGPPVAFAGGWLISQSYAVGAAVSYGGGSYIAIAANAGRQPDVSPLYWGVLAAAGAAGPAGVQGATGFQGPTGFPGATGPAGQQGAAGSTGAAGVAGVQGAVGPAGSAGIAGAPGAPGTNGAAGAIGPQGPPVNFTGGWLDSRSYAVGDAVSFGGASYIATAANVGLQPNANPLDWGLLAVAGVQGATGPQGAMGLQGDTGFPGATGAAGPQGIAGAAGAQGMAGPQGVQGVAGPMGSAGVAGVVGPAGADGVAGAVGPQGAPVAFAGGWLVGQSYAIGDAVSYGGGSYIAVAANVGRQPDVSPAYWGVLAAAGAAGPAGVQGAMGFQGPTGFPGAIGPAGPQGAAGNSGGQGVAGAQGVQGPAGPMGLTGATGVAGPVGGAGPAGAVGPQGAPVAFAGGWLVGQSYSVGDAVSYGGGSYIAVAANMGRQPDVSPSYWGVLSAPGAVGPAGVQGATGLQGPTGFPGTTGAVGPQGLVGAQGPIGVAGPSGSQGSAGPQGAVGATGAQGLVFRGAYDAGTNYALGDAVSLGGSSYVSLVAANLAQTPGASPTSWGLLAASGSVGATGAAGAIGPQGLQGVQGSPGVAGVPGTNGAAGAVGMNFRGGWNSGSNYAVNDAVTFSGSTYLAEIANQNQEPDVATQAWTVIAQAGGAGPTGAQGVAGLAASVALGTVTTLAAGGQATVTNTGTAAAAVLNFGIPQGAAGTGGTSTGDSGGKSFAAMYHAVNFSTFYYSVNAPTAASSETGAVLAWVPKACSAVRLDVFSQQSNAVTVTLRVGAPGAMVDTLSCVAASVASGGSGTCPAVGAVAVAAGSFMDLNIAGASGTTAGVWTSVECD
jgi:collagen type VII alpha